MRLRWRKDGTRRVFQKKKVYGGEKGVRGLVKESRNTKSVTA